MEVYPMSRSALALGLPSSPVPAFESSPELAPWVSAPLAPGWQGWVTRLDAVLVASCGELRRLGRRARRITVTLRLADGRVRRKTLTVPRSSDYARDFRPAALGLLRLLVDQHPTSACRVSVSLGQLVEGANQPIRFERFLAARGKKRSGLQRLVARLFG
jgi:hypothetical protein